MTRPPILTEHELAALRLLARGLHHLEIATVLGVRPQTAGSLLYSVRIRLRARTLPHAVACGYETGILRPVMPGDAG